MAIMNRYCREANNLLKKFNPEQRDEVILFINNFNNKIEEYSANGLSSFILNAVELCIKLSVNLGYSYGEAKTRWLKGKLLSLGGQYRNALKSFYKAQNLLTSNDPLYYEVSSSIALDLVYTGDLRSAIYVVNNIIKAGLTCHVNFILSIILKHRHEEQLSLDLLHRCKNESDIEGLQRINRLVDLGETDEGWNLLSSYKTVLSNDNDFILGYIHSIDLLISAKRGEDIDLELLPSVINQLRFNKSLFHYIAGLINISEVYLYLGDTDSAFTLLNKANESKKELKSLDIKIHQLMEKIALSVGDFQKAHENNCIVQSILKDSNNFEINKSLREMTDYLYQTECVVS